MKLPTPGPDQGPLERREELARGRWRPRRGRGYKVAAWAILGLIALGTAVMVLTILQTAWGLLA